MSKFDTFKVDMKTSNSFLWTVKIIFMKYDEQSALNSFILEGNKFRKYHAEFQFELYQFWTGICLKADRISPKKIALNCLHRNYFECYLGIYST